MPDLVLQDPTGVVPGSEVRSLLAEVEHVRGEIADLGEFSPEVQEELRKSFLPERIADTLTIEGINVNPRVTRSILEGLALADSDRYAEQGVLNIVEANDFVESLVTSDAPLDALAIREIHRKVMERLMDNAGTFRNEDVEISGASFVPPSWGDVPELVGEATRRYQALESDQPLGSPIVAAAWVHVSLAAIHPFKDGNGRVARLTQDYALMRGGLLPVGIPAGRRGEYYEALSDADRGNWDALLGIIANSQLTTLERTRRIADAPTKRRARIRSLVQASKTVRKRSAHQLYEVWRRQVDAVREEFERWAATLNEEDDSVAVRVKVWDPISFEKWEEIRQAGRAVGTWVFTLNVFIENRRVFSCLFYARRHEFNYALDHDRDAVYKTVGLFLTAAAEGSGDFNFGRFKDPYLRLREIVHADDGRMLVYRDPHASARGVPALENVEIELVSDDRWQCEEDPPLGEVVEELLRDVFLKLGLTG